MATDQEGADVPETGGVFTFGRSRFGDDLPNKFWIKNDEVRNVACGDEHTILLADSGRLFVFGDNTYGQLGLGTNKPSNKPTCIKNLKGKRISAIGCGKSHSLVATKTGQLYTFGQNSEGQCGVEAETMISMPHEVTLSEPLHFTQLCGGSGHSAGLTEDGDVYMWGCNGDGQVGLDNEEENFYTPTLLDLEGRAVHISCGYYHTAVVTASGDLYTFGESDLGKLGHDGDLDDGPVRVPLPEKCAWAACGGNHTVAVTVSGKVYTFGDGQNGQLGQGTSKLEGSSPSIISSLQDIMIVEAQCGESFTALVSDSLSGNASIVYQANRTAVISHRSDISIGKGQLYTFGDGRHGKLALGQENTTNQFRPFRVPSFSKFSVSKVSCGGCHMIALAKRKITSESDDEEPLDPMNSTIANSTLRQSFDSGELGGTARDRRRVKEPVNETLNRTLPQLNSSLPPLRGVNKLQPLNNSKLPATLDKRRLPTAKFGDGDRESEEDDSEVSVTPEQSEEEDESPRHNTKSQRELMKQKSLAITNNKGKASKLSKVGEKELNSAKSSRARKPVKKKLEDSEEESEVDSALEGSEPDEPVTRKNKAKAKPIKSKKKPIDQSDDEEEDSEEDRPIKSKKATKTSSRPKSSVAIFGKGKKGKADPDSEEDEETDEDEDEEYKKKNVKNSKVNKKSKKIAESEDEDGNENNSEDEEGRKEKNKGIDDKENKQENNPEPAKKSRACVIL